MKKISTLFLATIMSLLVVACGSETKKVDVVGTWINIATTSHGMVMNLEEGGTGTVSLGEEVLELTWERTDEDTLVCNADSQELLFEIGIADGVAEMRWQGVFAHYTMVSEEDYKKKINAIEITMDNWQDYFEIKPYIDVRRNDFDEIDDIKFGTKMVLKEEYADKFAGADGAVEVLKKDSYYCNVEYNAATGEYVIGDAYSEDVLKEKDYYTSDDDTISDKLSNYGKNGLTFGGYRGGYPDSKEVNGDTIKIDVENYANIDVIKIKGNLYLNK